MIIIWIKLFIESILNISNSQNNPQIKNKKNNYITDNINND